MVANTNSNGYIKIKFTTALILAGVVFLSNLFGGWIQSKADINRIETEVKSAIAQTTTNTKEIAVLKTEIINIKEKLSKIDSGVDELLKKRK